MRTMLPETPAGFTGSIEERTVGRLTVYVVDARRRWTPTTAACTSTSTAGRGSWAAATCAGGPRRWARCRPVGPHVGGRLPDAARAPVPDAARRLPRDLPGAARRAPARGDHRRRRLRRWEPRRRAGPAGPRRGPAAAGRGRHQHGRVRPDRGGDSMQTNAGLDNLLQGGDSSQMELYAGGHDRSTIRTSHRCTPTSPASRRRSCSPAPATCCSPTTSACTGRCAAGVDAELHVWEAAAHGGFLGMAPEDQERMGEMRRFVDRHWATVTA